MAKIRIDTIRILPFGMLNAYLLVHEEKAVLVDTGLPGSEAKIETALARNGLDWSHLSLIVLTHAHIDHAGSACKIRELSSSKIVAHADEVPYCMGAEPTLRASGLFGHLFKATGAIQRPFDYFAPDIEISQNNLDLNELGFPATVVFTPGHTPGSLSVIVDDQRVIAGDIIASGILLGGIAFKAHAKSPPFEEDPALVSSSLSQLVELGCKTFYLGHGGPLPASAVEKHAAFLRA